MLGVENPAGIIEQQTAQKTVEKEEAVESSGPDETLKMSTPEHGTTKEVNEGQEVAAARDPEPDQEAEEEEAPPRKDKGKRKLNDDEVADIERSSKRREVEDHEEAEDLLPDEEDEDSAVETSEDESGSDEDDSDEEEDDDDDEDDEDAEGEAELNMTGKQGSSSAMAEDLTAEMEDAQELQDLFEDLDELDSAAIFTVSGRRTRGKQIDFAAAIEREKMERGGAGGASSAAGGSGSAASAGVAQDEDEEEEDDGFDEDYEE